MKNRNRGADSLWSRHLQSAFTLVELLVVVSIIALLISILLPSLKKAREQAKSSVCLSHLKGTASASITYAAQEKNEQAVPVHWTESAPQALYVGAYEYGGKSGKGEPITGNDLLESRWGTKYGRGPATRPLNKMLYKGGIIDHRDNRGPGSVNWINDANLDLENYLCPADRGYSAIHYTAWKNSRMTSYDHFGTSFAASIFWIGTGPGSLVESNSPYLRPISRIPNPARTIYYEENVGRFAWSRDPDQCPWADGVSGIVKGWHGKNWIFNVAFVDGHGGTIKMDGYHPERLPYYPESDEHGLQCVVVRGPGWQKDTLPSPFVKSAHPQPDEGRPTHEGQGTIQ